MNWKRRASLVAMLAAIAGCAGGDGPVTTGSFVTDAAPLPTIERDIWELAPAGCEDVLNADVEFGIADAAPELVVVLGNEGVLCVDTYSSLEADLVTIDPERMDALWLGYVAALQEVEAFSDPSTRSSHEQHTALDTEYDPREAQPQPQPSMGSPVSIEEASVQPQPQPSEPTPPAAGNEGSDGTMNMHDMDCPPGQEDGPRPPPI